MNEAKIIGLTLLAGTAIGGLVGYKAAEKMVKPIVVNHVQFVEKKVYVKTKTQTQTTTTKPDGTTTTTTSITTGEENATTNSTTSSVSNTRAAIKLGAYGLLSSDRTMGGAVSAGARVYEDTWITGQVGYLERPFIGLGLEVQR